jgi:hypothetical protein
MRPSSPDRTRYIGQLKLFLMMTLLLRLSDAHAYVDPGTGMLLVQGLIAAIVAVATFIRNPWAAIKNKWKRWRSKSDA